MQIIAKNLESNLTVPATLDDGRRSLANFLSILDKNLIDDLEIRDCKDTKLPRSLQHLKNLKTLHLVRCHALAALSPELGCLPNLQELGYIQCADFHDLTGIAQCKSLKVLHVSGCGCFDAIPAELSNMQNLQALDLSYSDGIGWIDLTELPKSLRLLDMHGCWQGDFDENSIPGLRLASLQIQDWGKDIDWDNAPTIPNLATQLRHTLALRNGCALDN